MVTRELGKNSTGFLKDLSGRMTIKIHTTVKHKKGHTAQDVMSGREEDVLGTV